MLSEINISRNVKDLDFSEIPERICRVFDLSQEDVELAVCAYITFLDFKIENFEFNIILPKIVDWVWHESILDTKKYSKICESLFGRYLHHTIRPRNEHNRFFLDDTFNRTAQIFKENYGIEFTRLGWTDAGWNQNFVLRQPSEDLPNIEENNQNLQREIAGLDLEWLKYRLHRRWYLSENNAKSVICAYRNFLNQIYQNPYQEIFHPPSFWVDAAWREHILWTKRYHIDSELIFGFYAHRILD